MADVTKEIALKVVATDATGPALESLEDKLNNAKKRMLELAAAGQQNTEEFKSLTVEAGNYKRTIEGVEQTVDKFSKGGSKALTLFVDASQAVAAGFAIAQGAAALFGDENEDLQKAMMKVQGAMALATGVQQMSVLLQKESALMMGINTLATNASTVAQRAYAFAVGTSTGAMRIFKIALISTGIGAIVVALGFAIEAMGLFASKTEESTEALEAQNKAMEDSKAAADAYTRLLKAQGVDETSLNNRRIASIERESFARKMQLDDFVKNRISQNSLIDGMNKDQLKALIDNLEAEKLELQKANKDIAQGKINTATQTNNELLAIQNKYKLQLELLNTEGLRKELIAIDQKYAEELAKLKRYGKDTKDLEEVIRIEKLAKEKEFGFALINVQKDLNQRVKENKDKQESEEFERLRSGYLRTNAIELKKLEDAKTFAEESKKIDKAVADYRTQVTMDSVGSITEILKAFSQNNKGLAYAALALEKGAAIANVIINLQKEMQANNATAAANPLNATTGGAAGLAQGLKLNALSKIRAKIRIATIVATGIAAAKGIASGGESGGGGGNPPAPAGGNSTATPAPSFTNPQTTNLGTGELSGGQGQGSQPMRAYVVERDIQQTTSRVRRLSEFATLG